MRRYATDNDYRKIVFYVCAGLGIGTQFLLSAAMKYFGFQHFSATVAAPSAIGFAGLYYTLFDRILWDRFPFRRIFQITDFSGHWCGYIVDRVGFQKRNLYYEKIEDRYIPIEILISQTFSKIQINFKSYRPKDKGGPSESTSTITGLFKSDGSRPELKYVFQREDLIGFNYLRYKKSQGAKFLEGDYFSNMQRQGRIVAVKNQKNRRIFLSYPSIMTSSSGNEYLACNISSSIVSNYLPSLSNNIGDKEFETIRNHRSARDGQYHHMTILNSSEYRDFYTDIDGIFYNTPVWISVLGIGRAFSINAISEFKSYYLICESRRLNDFRRSLGLSKRDFHITLGFMPQDLHNVSKSKDTLFISA